MIYHCVELLETVLVDAVKHRRPRSPIGAVQKCPEKAVKQLSLELSLPGPPKGEVLLTERPRQQRGEGRTEVSLPRLCAHSCARTERCSPVVFSQDQAQFSHLSGNSLR